MSPRTSSPGSSVGPTRLSLSSAACPRVETELMPITVIVRSIAGDEPRLTFDGTQRVVIGRGAGSDVRVPDATVSHRHASLRAQGAEFVVVDEGSSNGTFVGGVRVAARMSRLVRSGDWVRVGRVWLRVLVDQS